jgi:hypothetical protein
MVGPTKSEVMIRLRELADRGVSPSSVAEWAMSYFRTDDLDDVDDCVLVALDRMAGADLLAGPGEALHDIRDFKSWLDEFRTCVEKGDVQ